jgi:hypothetical protein
MSNTASEVKLQMDVAEAEFKALVKAHDECIQELTLNALQAGTGVFYAVEPQHDGPLMICPMAGDYGDCCTSCSCSMVHVCGECGEESVRNPKPHSGTCPQCQPIDQEVADECEEIDRIDRLELAIKTFDSYGVP